jgi:hypothetical protein
MRKKSRGDVKIDVRKAMNKICCPRLRLHHLLHYCSPVTSTPGQDKLTGVEGSQNKESWDDEDLRSEKKLPCISLTSGKKEDELMSRSQ